MKNQKRLFILWGIIVVILIILLTVLGFMTTNKNKKYHELEDKLKVAAEKHSSDNFIFQEGVNNYKITSEELLETPYLDNLDIESDKCTGYVTITFDQVYEYKAYIKCNNYKTKGYQNN